MFERDFREVCCAVLPRCWHWEEVEQGCGQAPWMGRGWMHKESLQEPGSFGGSINVFTSHCWPQRGETQALLRGGWQKDRSQPQGSLQHDKFWLGTRGKKIPKKIVKLWSRESGSFTSLKVWDLDRMRPWATWSSGICAEEEAGLNDLQRCLPT